MTASYRGIRGSEAYSGSLGAKGALLLGGLEPPPEIF